MENPVTIAGRPHLFPSRTQKLSSLAPMILGGKLPGKVGRCRFKWLHGQAVKTPPFHGGNPGSIPGGVTNTVEEWELKSSHFSNQRRKHSVRKWLRGRASPCQGEGREFESRLPLHFFINVNCIKNKSGDYSDEVTPVPISNTEVKLFSADDTWWEAAWESRTLPVQMAPWSSGQDTALSRR